MAGSADSIAIYVHIPWCAALCPYCDFDKQATEFGLIDAYVDALAAHVAIEPPRPAHSLFFGGGTPSLLTPARLGRVIDACRAHFPRLPTAEVTVEANPSDVVVHKMAAYLERGVTRASLGVQSFDDAELRFLGRRHTADKAVRAFHALRAAGCQNISVDLMYGSPGSSRLTAREKVEQAIDLGPDHVSAYALTLEPETPMGREMAEGRLLLPEDDLLAEQYEEIQERLRDAGLVQYELSNWARPGRESVHNLTYWRNGEWLGLGAGASGSIAGGRYKRTPIVRDYIAAAARGEPGCEERETWSKAMMARDTIMLGLRLAEGVSKASFMGRFDLALETYCTDQLGLLLDAGLLRWSGDRLQLSPRGYFVCNSILARLLPPIPPSSPQ